MARALSNRVSKWEVLPTAALHGEVLEMQQQGVDIIDLTIGISNRPIPDSGKQAAIQAITTNDVPYTAITGSSKLKTAIQQKLQKENNISCDLEQILVTTGAKQAIFQTLYVLTNPGDEVAMVTPYWSAYTQIAAMLKLTPVFFTIDDIPNLAGKKYSPKLKALLFDLPHNPTGKVFRKDELKAVVSFAKKNNLYIIADESYEKLVYEGQQISLATIDKEFRNNIITIFSVSQSFSMMGWRLGYAVASKKIIAAMEAVQSSITAATSAVTQAAVAALLPNEALYVKSLREEFQQRRDVIYQKLTDIPWMQCDLPQSGPYFWCNIQQLTANSLDFAATLLQEKKVAVMPGEALGSPGWIRLAFNVQPIPVLEDAVHRIAQFGETYAK